MCAGMYIGFINIQIVASSLQQIQAGLGATADQVSWVLTAALIAEVIMIPLSGWLSRVVSTRWLFTGCVGGFTVASFGCANAWNIESMIVFRALQGFGGGALMPMVFATVYTVIPRHRQTFVMTVVAIISTSSLAIGPALGGWLTEVLDWRWLFWVNLPIGLAIMATVAALVRFDRPEPGLLRQVDFLGIALAAVSLGCLLIVLEEGRRQDWFDSTMIVALAIVSALAGYLFLWRELTARHPVVDLRVFKDLNFTIGTFYIAMFGALLYIPVYLLPLYLARVRDIDTFQIGTIMAVLGLSMVLSGAITGILLRYLSRRVIALIGFSTMALGTWSQSFLTSEYGFAEFLLPQVLRGLATQLCWLSMATLALGSLAPHQVRNGSALFNLVMRLGAAVSIAVANAALYVRTRVHYAEIAETVQLEPPDVTSIMPQLRSMFESVTGDSPLAGQAGLSMIVDMAQREALVLAFNDVTLAAAVVGLLSLVLLPLIRERPHEEAGAGAADQVPSQSGAR